MDALKATRPRKVEQLGGPPNVAAAPQPDKAGARKRRPKSAFANDPRPTIRLAAGDIEHIVEESRCALIMADRGIYAPAGGESRPSWRITADTVLSAKAKPKTRTKKERAPHARAERARDRRRGGEAV